MFSTYQEKGNLFTVVIALSGAGKTPACHLGCIDPIVEHLDLQDACLGEITVGKKLTICYKTEQAMIFSLSRQMSQ